MAIQCHRDLEKIGERSYAEVIDDEFEFQANVRVHRSPADQG